MSNIFLEGGHDDIETAIMLERAKQCDLALLSPSYKNAVAFTDGRRVFINSDDNLTRILPDYNKGMLKWLLWHERYHMELKHHKRYFKFLDDLRKDKETLALTQAEVNIIMDILVHDSLAKMFPELIETAVTNLAQMRNRNSLGYTFKTFTLEEMLEEFAKTKTPPEESEPSEGEGTPEEESEEDKGKEGDTPSGEKAHEEGGSKPETSISKSEDKKPEDSETPEETDGESEHSEPEPEPEHDKTDWSKLEEIEDKEFIDSNEGNYLDEKINKLKRQKFKLAKLTQTLNGMVTTTKMRTYRVPSRIQLQPGVMMKGKLPGRTNIYLVFDASGSMGGELAIFKKIVKEAIPQAMDVPTEWFSGWTSDGADEQTRYSKHYNGKTCRDYHKGKFKDILPVYASSGYGDDGDRVIELCLLAEEKGYSPIGITDGGGGIYNPAVLKKLKRTILVCREKEWLDEAKRINPSIQTLEIELR
jgi:hypothetical protein